MQKSSLWKHMTVFGGLVIGAVLLIFAMPILLPFLLAGVLALISEPLVSFFCRRRLPRAAATALGVTLTLGLIILLLMTLLALVLRELRALSGVVPDLALAARRGLSSLEDWLTELALKCPQSLQPLATQSVEGLFSGSSAFLDEAARKLLGLASALLSRLPDSALGFGTWLLAGFMISARLPKIKAWAAGYLPASWREKTLPALKRLKQSVGGWLWAQLKLMGLTFLVLAAGFLLLQIPYWWLWAVLISFVDVLPVLGTGTVLVPWALVCWLQGEGVRAVGLLGIYAVAWLLRSVLEPRFVGRQLGLDPLLTLFSMYAGYRLFGLGGMILSPLAAVTVTQLLRPSPEE